MSWIQLGLDSYMIFRPVGLYKSHKSQITNSVMEIFVNETHACKFCPRILLHLDLAHEQTKT